MDDDEVLDEISTQLGLLLTQVRYARMALDRIERATTRYAGVALSIPSGPGAALGAPPLLDGALKVHVVNINDLTAGGGGLGDLIQGVLGGAGRFLGGFFGGLVGGTVGGVAFPYTIAQFARIIESIERIANRLGLPTGGAAAPAAASGGGGLLDQLDTVAATLRQVAAIFGAATPGQAPVELPPATRTLLDLTSALTRTVDGLILLIPLLVGALAAFLIRIDDIKLAIVDLLQFALRNALLLRAAVLATVLDTLALAGRLAGSILGIVATAVDTVLESVLRVLHTGLETALTAVQVVSTGLKGTIDALMLFLRDGLGALLIFLGSLQVFRLVFHLARVLPAVLPAIARIVGTPLSKEESRALGAAAAILPPPGSGARSAPVPIAQFPDLAATLLPPDQRDALVKRVDDLGGTIRAATSRSLTGARQTLEGIGRAAQETVGTLDRGLGTELETRLGTAKGHAERLAEALQAAETASRTRPQTGLEAIAGAYEGWLRGGGLRTLMEQITEHFQRTPTEATGAGRTIPGRVVSAAIAAGGEQRVVVEIGEVTIELGEATGAAAGGPAGRVSAFDPDAYLEWRQSYEDRGGLVPV